jgi:DNA-binding protein Fis
LFCTSSQKLRYIIKGLELSKSLFVSSLVIGEPHIGKKTLLKSIFPNTIWIDGSDTKALKNAMANYSEIIIYNFNIYGDYNISDFNGKKIIAISDTINTTTQMDSIFSFVYTVPSLTQRPEDVEYLSEKFSKEAQSIFGLNDTTKYVPIANDLLNNTKSLKKAILLHHVYNGVTIDDMEKILYKYFGNELGGNNDYNKFLPILERPLIESGLNKFGSQLKLSSILGINRNTLRKKINELGIN